MKVSASFGSVLVGVGDDESCSVAVNYDPYLASVLTESVKISKMTQSRTEVGTLGTCLPAAAESDVC